MAVTALNKQNPEQQNLMCILPMWNTIVCHLSKELYRTNSLQYRFLQIHKHKPEHTSIPSMTKAGNSTPPPPTPIISREEYLKLKLDKQKG